ncbi:MAG: VWA domain-containing protein [Bacteroidota bacterium]
MTWYQSLSFNEYLFIGIFVLLYILYITRTVQLARRLHTTARSVILKFSLRSFYFVLLIMALLGPSFGESKKEIKTVGKDIYMAVDLSQSMDATDIQPSRLERVKFELQNLVNSFNSDRIGLIIFSSEAFMQCPLTYDQSALALFIQTLNTKLVPSGGTDFGPPLRMALERHLDSENTSSQNQAKIIILISDGEDFGDEAADVIDDIESNGVRLFTLGIGTTEGSRIPLPKGGFKKDKEGVTVVSKLNSEDLQKLAKKADGAYFEINDKKSEVPKLISTIASIEGQLKDKREIDVSANKYYYFLILALALIGLDTLITVRTMRV